MEGVPVIRFLRTAEWQIGIYTAYSGEKAKFVGQKRYEKAGSIVELA
jgi:hypothetical protein